MDIRQLQAFIAVYEERNITAAAKRLYITQPSLSVTIRQLEDELASTLFQRETRGVSPTGAARQLYPRAQQLINQASALKRQFRERETCQQLSLGIEGEPGNSQIERLLSLVAESDPMLQLSLYYGNNGPVRLTTAECCQNGETFRTLWEEPFVIVLRTDHPLAMRAHLDRADLAGVDWVVCPQHRTHQQLLPWYGQQDTLPCFAAEAGSLALALALVAAGVGLALLPASLAAGRNDLTSRALPEQGPIRQVGLCYRQPVLADETLGRLFDILQSLQAIP